MGENKEDLLNIQSHPQEEHIFLCSQCNEEFPSLDSCKVHMLKSHSLQELQQAEEHLFSQKGQVDDDSVKKTLVSQSAQNSVKVNREKISKKFRCTEVSCGYVFSTEEKLKYHLSCHDGIQKGFICVECGERHPIWKKVIGHLWKKHKIDMDLYKCNTCDYRTYNIMDVERHEFIHSDKRQFLCVKCGKSFKQLSQLRNHNLIHKNKTDLSGGRWYSEQKCDICKRKYSDKKSLKKHVEAVHNKNKPFVCDFCGYLTYRKGMLEMHIRNHTGEKPFQCEYCNYSTGDHNTLRKHRKRHTGEKTYKCPHCCYSSIQAVSLKSHMISKHPGKEGVYSCAFCQFCSINKENYENHVADHKRGLIPDSVIRSTEKVPYNPVLQTQPQNVAMPESCPESTTSYMKAAETIYKCLHALTQADDTTQLPPGVTATANPQNNGCQTVTIEIPGDDKNIPQQYLLTIQPSTSDSLQIMFQPPELTEPICELQMPKLTDEMVANSISLSELDPTNASGSSSIDQIVNNDPLLAEDIKNIDSNEQLNSLIQLRNIVFNDETEEL